MNQFKPDRYKRIGERHDKKNVRSPVKNQPAPIAFKIELKWLYPKDKTRHYMVSTEKRLSLEELDFVANRLAELYETNVWVYDGIFVGFDVYLEDDVSWQLIEECMLKVLRGG